MDTVNVLRSALADRYRIESALGAGGGATAEVVRNPRASA